MSSREIYEKCEDFGGCLQIEKSGAPDFDEGLLEILPRIEDVQTNLAECKDMLREISKEQSLLLLTTGFRRGLAYSSYTYMPLLEAQILAGEFISSLTKGAKYFSHCSIPDSEESSVRAWTGRITGATFELCVYVVAHTGCTLFLITDED
jgi:hypothetical protein